MPRPCTPGYVNAASTSYRRGRRPGLAGTVLQGTPGVVPGARACNSTQALVDLSDRERFDASCGGMMRLAGRPGGGVHPFQLESIMAGGDSAVLRAEGDLDAYAA